MRFTHIMGVVHLLCALELPFSVSRGRLDSWTHCAKISCVVGGPARNTPQSITSEVHLHVRNHFHISATNGRFMLKFGVSLVAH